MEHNKQHNNFRDNLGGGESQDIYQRRVQQLQQNLSNLSTEEKITEDALRGTAEELAQDKQIHIREALLIIWEYVVRPYRISENIFNKVKVSLLGWFDPL